MLRPNPHAMSLFALLLLAMPAAGSAQEVVAPVPEAGYDLRHDTSPPLRDIAIRVAPPPGFEQEIRILPRPDSVRKPPETFAPDGGVQAAFRPYPGAAPTPPPLVSAPGLSDDDNDAIVGFRVVPPDTNGDIGLDDAGNRIFIQYINLIWGVFDDTGALIDGPFAGNTFWAGFGGSCETNNDGDPIVLYDDQVGRWFFSQFSINQGIQCVAVSVTSDPLGPYHRYAFAVTPGGLNDYPKLGIWADGTSDSTGQSAYTFTMRDFGGAGGSFSVSAGVMERDQMLQGLPAQFIKFSNPCTGTDCIEGQLPPHLAGEPPPPGTCPTFWTAVDAAYDDSPHADDGYRNHTLCVDWSNINSSTYTEGPLVVAGSNFDRFLGGGFSDCISPVNGGEVLDCLAAFTMYRAQYRWFGANASVVLNTTVDATGADVGGIRWAEVQSGDGQSAWFLGQDGTYAPADGNERWMGSIAQDREGNIALGYSVTSGSLFPAVRYTSRMAGDPPGTMPGGEVSCHEGTGAQTGSSNRWGDYSSMSVDPTDDCTFWYTQEYYEVSGSFDFNTRICSFVFDSCVADFSLTVTPASIAVCAPEVALYTVDVGGGGADVTLSVADNPAGTTASFDVNPVTPPGSSTLTVSDTELAVPGSYLMTVSGDNGEDLLNRSVGLDIFAAAPGAPVLTMPPDGATNQDLRPTFEWQEAANGGLYTIEIATDAAFANIIDSATGLINTSYTPGFDLDSNTEHFWRVRAENACGGGPDSAIFSFITMALPGDCSVGSVPVELFFDDLESGAAGWTHSGTGDTWVLSSARTHSGVNAFHATDVPTVSDQLLVSPAVTLPMGQSPLTLQFWNFQSIESSGPTSCFDGAVLEVSTDGGATWIRLETELLTDPYDGPISTTFGNPLGGQNAWCGDPQDWLNSIAELDAFAGETVNLRFRLATDTSVSREGWYVDDVLVQGCAPESGLVLGAPVPGDAGVMNAFDLSGATPNGRVLMVRGTAPGSFELPPCPGVFLDMSQPRRFGAEVADGSGNAVFNRFIPAGASGSTRLFQVVDLNACAVSNLVTHTFP